ncbi:transcription initiation factor TFIID subunit 9B [Daktulosphaira vitifoliae]|uniref:transcription initiation factor TFIID subunit 9B n=1 Tax=Daktulosphaira vitifoliae TaxID=58002 RepID=UPI0021AA3DC8|nr:transcription initiation factor TFIID subunit 9B [Daktulosphaira vitifoliae]
MAAAPGKHMPKDTQIIVSIMKDLGIYEYDQQVLNHLLEFNYRYTTLLLDDAKTYSNYAKKKNVDVDDVKVAIQMAQDGIFFRPPPRDVLISASNEINKIPLPSIKPASGLRIPHDRSNFLQTNYKLKDDLCTGPSIIKNDQKTTAAELLEGSRKVDVEESVISQTEQNTNNWNEFMEERRSSIQGEPMDIQNYESQS